MIALFRFAAGAALVAGITMLVFMTGGESIIRPGLFGGVQLDPVLWLLILLESAIWIFPLALIGGAVLRRWRPRHLRFAAFTLWGALGGAILLAYKFVYFPVRDFVTAGREAELLFGWIFPCAVIWAWLVARSPRLIAGRG